MIENTEIKRLEMNEDGIKKYIMCSNFAIYVKVEFLKIRLEKMSMKQYVKRKKNRNFPEFMEDIN